MRRLDDLLNGYEGRELVKQNLLLAFAEPLPNKDAGPSLRPGLSKTIEIEVKRESPGARLGAGFDKCVNVFVNKLMSR